MLFNLTNTPLTVGEILAMFKLNKDTIKNEYTFPVPLGQVLVIFDGICLDVDNDGPGESSVDVIVDVDGVDILQPIQ